MAGGAFSLRRFGFGFVTGIAVTFVGVMLARYGCVDTGGPIPEVKDPVAATIGFGLLFPGMAGAMLLGLRGLAGFISMFILEGILFGLLSSLFGWFFLPAD